ncbi:DNA polymerase epsilon catalytic subunit A [Tanacetum coccineum]
MCFNVQCDIAMDDALAAFVILWVSDNGISDLGGDNEEEICYSDEVNQPVLTFPGAYRKVTVELKIHNLAVNALLKSNQVNEMEGGLDEATSCSPAFRVLKQLIQRCLADAVSSGNIYADAMLQHLYRWLCSPRSKIHDPSLHQMLRKIELEPMQFWHSLLFMDQDHFILIVSEFMHRPWTFARDQVRKREKIRDDDSCTPSITVAAAEIYESSMTEYLSEEISSTSQRIFRK